MRRFQIAAAVVVGLLALLLIGLGVAWSATGAPDRGRVAPHVELGGINISGLDKDQLGKTLTELADDYSYSTVEIGPDGSTFRTNSVDIGLAVDRAETMHRVMDVGRTGALPSRIIDWIGSWFSPRQADVVVTWNNDKLESTISTLDPGPRTEPAEPSLRFADNVMNFDEGKEGTGISASDVAKELPDAARKGLPVRVKVDRGTLNPTFSVEDLRVAFELYKSGYTPLPLISGSKTVPLSFDALQPWLRARVANNALAFTIDEEAANKDLPAIMVGAGVPVVEAHWEVHNHVPQFASGTPGSECCEPLAAINLRNALFPAVGAQAPSVDLGLRPVEPKPAVPDPAWVGIKERVSTFSTSYTAGQPRAKNIHLISDLVRGAVIKPGEVFSLNGHVGPRTVEKGFLTDHAISDGVYVDAVGGGISQFSTTLFNAAFFAGLEWDAYQAHTIYISRYPYGREATVSYPHPDQKIRNNTPYSILIWPSYTARTVTVDLYSTKYVDAEQTGQSETKVGECTRVTTERTRRYLDGRTAIDTVGALYQPAEGVRC